MKTWDNLIPEMASDETVLGKIIKQRQTRISQRNNVYTAKHLTPSKRSLIKNLTSSATGFILECKKSSPSRGQLSDNYQPDQIAGEYQQFASAVSVLTEPDFFSGNLDDLRKVREVVSLPVLCKDFVIDTSQIYQARAAGADIILLMLSVITDTFWMQCYEIANELGLDIITEIHNEQELSRALLLPAKIIGINNRNLHTLKTDVSVTKALVSQIPDDRLIISESGISTHQQLKDLGPLVDGFLIGSSLMQSKNIALALRRLIFGEIKICGLTRREDADLAWQLGASYGGMIFTSVSSRCINLQQAKNICNEQLMPMVGVFKDQSLSKVTDIANELSLYGVQLHGDEDIEYIEQLNKALDIDIKIWKAISCSETSEQYPTIEQAVEMSKNLLSNGIDKVLIDTPKDKLDHQLDYQVFLQDNRILIAGGLQINSPLFQQTYTREMNSQAGFDLCSSLEQSAGIKDPEKMKKLFNSLQPKTRKHHES
ncbi:MAG: bifunctional indole-3-glycerol-phosphate synthase TrpC/phosphoribosylanthranilate isomerase TrpF [Gammaproteobacteria bacterium]|nr:bifunctional indole-3-glycerol-phosphate synthase TrpC/phosphoribosylanthranilate isomerase TrpF [Gammaproteobacteria bacterium]